MLPEHTHHTHHTRGYAKYAVCAQVFEGLLISAYADLLDPISWWRHRRTAVLVRGDVSFRRPRIGPVGNHAIANQPLAGKFGVPPYARVRGADAGLAARNAGTALEAGGCSVPPLFCFPPAAARDVRDTIS